jgi:hypothetical protein
MYNILLSWVYFYLVSASKSLELIEGYFSNLINLGLSIIIELSILLTALLIALLDNNKPL